MSGGTVCRLSRRGMTVILSIHQPRYSIYKLFDTLMLLHDGECVYNGPAAETLDFFASASELVLSASSVQTRLTETVVSLLMVPSFGIACHIDCAVPKAPFFCDFYFFFYRL